jgi:hypothetical protein
LIRASLRFALAVALRRLTALAGLLLVMALLCFVSVLFVSRFASLCFACCFASSEYVCWAFACHGYLGVSCGCLRPRKLASGVASLTASLLLGFGVGGWELKFVCLFACVVRLSASWEARLGRRVSDCVVASKVWGFGDRC